MNETNPSAPGGRIQVVDRLVGLLDAIGAAERPVSLKILSAETGLHPSTAYRILAAGVEHGLIERDEQGRYQLGLRFLRLASRVQLRVDLRREALPIMEWLRGEIGETVNLTLCEGGEVVYVERISSTKTIRVEQVIGGRAPLHVTAAGKLFLAAQGKVAFDRYVQRSGLPTFTPHTLVDAQQLWRDASEALDRGYALDNEEAELGVGCIATPVLNADGKMVAGLSVSAPIERRDHAWSAPVVDAGQKLSARLGHHGKST